MNGTQQLSDDLWRVLIRHRMESEITYAEAIGIIEIMKQKVLFEAIAEGSTKESE